MQQNNRTLVFGLGNPGKKYEESRHNVGFLALEKVALSKSLELKKPFFKCYRIARSESFLLVEPITYMNNSGKVFPELVKEGDRVIVIVDQMDIEPGRVKIKRGGSSAGHNGLKSIISNIGEDFIRVYIGTGHPKEGTSVIDHVLERIDESVLPLIEKGIDRASKAVLALLDGERLESVIQRVNSEKA